VFSEGTRPQLPPCEFFLFHSCRTPLSVPLSTRVDVRATVIICYLVIFTCSPLHHHS
jgi:hypothetical protein